MRVFQQVVKALFKGLYCRQRPQTEEDRQVCKILLEWACVHEDFVGSDALPDVYQRQPRNCIPIVCIPFVLREDLPSQEEAPFLYEVHAIGTCMLSEFLGLTHRLDNLLINSMYGPACVYNCGMALTDMMARHGVSATYADIPDEACETFIAASRLYAQAIVQYPLKKRGTLEQMRELILDHLPFAELHSWSGEDHSIRHRRRVATMYYAVFGEALDDLRLAQIICRHVNHSYDS